MFKEMKTKIKFQSTVVIFIVLFVVQVYSQGAYVNLGAGYGFPAAPYLMADNSTYHSYEIGYTVDEEIIKGSGSFGKGLQAGAIIGYMFNPNIGAELGISYLLGNKIESKNESINENSTYYHSYKNESKVTGKMLRFTPALKITVGNGNIKPYMKTGLVIGVAGKIKSTSKSTNSDDFTSETIESEMDLNGGISLGFAGALGADFMLSDNIGIFAEMGIITQSWAPKKGEYTKYSVDGVDKLNDFTTFDKEIEFIESYSFYTENTDYDSPRQELKTYFPFSSVGVNVGVKITLGGSGGSKE
jgi:outer membrane protein W